MAFPPENMVFPLEVKSDVDDDEDADDCTGETSESTSKNFDHHHHHHHHDTTSQFDSTASVHIPTELADVEPPGSLQLSPVLTPDAGTQPPDQHHAHFRFTLADSPHPVESAHAHNYASCCYEADMESEEFTEVKSSVEYSVGLRTTSNEDVSISSQICCSTDTDADVVTSSSSFFSLLSTLHKPQLLIRSLAHVISDVINSRRQRVPSAPAGDQSAASDAARDDDVDLTSLLATS